MATHLPQNQFNSADIPTADEAAASRSPPLPDAAAALSNSDGGVEGHAPEGSVSVAVRGLRQRRPRDMEAAGSQREAETGWSPEMARVREQASNCISQDSDRIAGPAAARCRAGIKPGPSEDIMHLEHNAVTQAIEVRPVSPGQPSSSLPSGESDPSVMLDYAPGESIHGELEQLIGVNRRPPALPRFAPDREAIWNAMFNPDAPRLRADDPVWADAAPLFLRGA